MIEIDWIRILDAAGVSQDQSQQQQVHADLGVREVQRAGDGLVALALVASLFLFGKYTEFLDVEALERAIGEFAQGPWGVPALVLTFCGCAFIGVPQFLLIGIGVYAFGPMWGAIWSWVATLVSGTLTFWIGRYFGAATLNRLGKGRLKRFADFVARNAFAASAIVRNVPTGRVFR